MTEKLLFAVTGNPVSHSKSPDIWNNAFKKLGIDAAYFRIHSSNMENVAAMVREIGIRGLNITSPHKESAIRHLDYIDDDAAEIGAVNTVAFINGLLRGYNTDFTGVIDSLASNGVAIANSKAVVIGGGGAARASVFALKKALARDVVVANRTYTKAIEISEQFACRACKLDDLMLEFKDTDILVSCISSSQRVVSRELLHKGLVVFDADYSRQSMLFRDAVECGCRLYITGTEWLLYQAVHSFLHFFEDDPLDLMRTALIRNLESTQVKPRSISLIGFMGTGKSAIGLKLAEIIGFEFVEIDKIIEQREGGHIKDIFDTKGEEYFRKVESGILESIDFSSPKIISCGGGIVINEQNRKILKSSTRVVWLWSDLNSILKRTENSDRPLLKGDNRDLRAGMLLKERIPLYADAAHICFANYGQTIDELAESIANEIY
ncbi:MAG: hypothetical protein JXA66_00235 [Oligoflexia bacterium]|nr:hypothetical protein [Oligoflexia bacterium]